MRNLLVSTGLLSCALLVLGCPFKKKDEADAAADAAVVDAEAPTAVVADAAPPAPVVTAKNAADVARFPAETAVTDDDMKLASTGYARTTPKTGKLVAALKPGTDVVKLAEYQDCVLATFADPKDASSTLMGWIDRTSFSAPAAVVKRDGGVSDAAAPPAVVDAGPPPKAGCPANFVSVVLAKDPVCRKKCAKDADCKGGAAGACANATTAAGGVARVCATE
ncbi:MAG TPA: hypothetical protein VM925_07570 [Labilithrix sp.]|nr:hypothetical protein [Labilithrix sp.]